MDSPALAGRRFKNGTRWVAMVSIAGGGAALAGWALNVSWMMSPIPGSAAMKANAALAFILLGSALWLVPNPRPLGPRVVIGRVLSSAAVLIGILTVIEYVTSADLRIDQAIVRDGAPGAYGAAGRMAPGAALAFGLLGLALLSRGSRPRVKHLDAWLCAPVAAIGTLALVGYAYRAPWLYNSGRYTSMAPHTAGLLVMLALVLMTTAQGSRIATLLTSERAGGRAVRRLLPVAIVGPAVIGGCALWGQRAGLFSTEIALALLVVATVVVLGVAIWRHAELLDQTERDRANVLESLDRRVQEQTALAVDAELRSFQLLEHLPVGVFVLSDAGVPVYANAMSQELLGKGLVPGAAVGDLAQVYRVVRADTDTEYPSGDMPVVRALRGEVTMVDDLEILRGDQRVLLEVRGLPILNSDGSVKYAVASFTDITERSNTRKLLDERAAELDRRAVHLERANNDLEQFAYVASHDLQEPLRMVASYVKLLKRRYRGRLDADADEMIDFAEEGAVRIKELVLDLQTYARVGRSPELPSPVSLRDCVDTAMLHLEPAIRESNARIRCDPLPSLLVSGAHITQVFESLLDNALKFHGEVRPDIQICAERGAGSWSFTVKDNGIGIHPQYAERVFVLFQRLNSRKEYSGTGMGLALCKKIVERYDGRIWVDSELGGGASFQFSLPIADRSVVSMSSVSR